RDPFEFARDFSLDADELNVLIHDKNRASKVVKTLLEEERRQEKERETGERVKKKPAALSGKSGPEDQGREAPVSREPPEPQSSGEEGLIERPSQKTLFDGF
ncbi:MAG: replication factor C large subunit, partial [Methanoregulaceae archaeon]|nr:replication factor C large subunit [Methanoregulaceae archaeon]